MGGVWNGREAGNRDGWMKRVVPGTAHQAVQQRRRVAHVLVRRVVVGLPPQRAVRVVAFITVLVLPVVAPVVLGHFYDTSRFSLLITIFLLYIYNVNLRVVSSVPLSP